jgi:pyrroline-5-carboxylate reductase
MAGVPQDLLSRRWKTRVTRMMPSGPDTFREGRGIVAVHPENVPLAAFLESMGFRVYPLRDEELMHIFTAMVCLPAALLLAGDRDRFAETDAIAREYPLARELLPWAFTVLPSFRSGEEREHYIAAMSTKGGITETIVKSIRSGFPLSRAFRDGIARSREIGREFLPDD